MRFVLLFLVLASSFSASAGPTDHIMTVKERLRLHLWHEGIQPGFKVTPKERQPKLPMELERPLSKL